MLAEGEAVGAVVDGHVEAVLEHLLARVVRHLPRRDLSARDATHHHVLSTVSTGRDLSARPGPRPKVWVCTSSLRQKVGCAWSDFKGISLIE